MKEESEKYRKVVRLLKQSEPKLDSSRELEERIMKRIEGGKHRLISAEDVIDFLFGWIYIGWIRRSLITASALLVMVFIYQQGLIMGRINYLSDQAGFSTITSMTSASDNLDIKLITLGLGNRFRSGNITVPKEKMDALLDSVNILQERYKNLIYLIEKDPELRKILNERASEKVSKKSKIQ